MPATMSAIRVRPPETADARLSASSYAFSRTWSGRAVPGPSPASTSPRSTAWRASVLDGFFGEVQLAEALHESGECLTAGERIVGGHAVEDPLERAGATAACAQARGERWVGRVDENREPWREDDGRAVHGDAHPSATTVARLEREALRKRPLTVGAVETEFARRGRAG